MRKFRNFLAFSLFGLFSCSIYSFQENIVPPGVRLAKTSNCGEEVRSDDGVLLPILKNPVKYPEFLAAENEEIFWVIIKFDVGVDAAPKNISVVGEFPKKLKNYFKEEFSMWRFPPCNSNGVVSEILDEQVLLRVSR